MKKRKLKIMNIIIAFLVFVSMLILIIFLVGLLKKDFKVDINVKTIEVGEEFSNDFKATFKNIDVTNNVEVSTNLNIKVAGIYEIKYIYKKNGKEYVVNKKIKVIDNEPPKITLKGGNDIIITDNNFLDPGFVALDNSDGDITDSVKTRGNVDTSKEGEYILEYYVSDKSGNETSVSRKVTVTSSSPLSMNIKDFTLDGLFESVTLNETNDGGKEYIENIIFAGDSMAQYYATNELISADKIWYQISITAENALTSPIYINNIDTDKTFVENFEKYKPEIIIMTLGTNSVAYMKPEYFYEKYLDFIKQVQKASPKTKIIVQSIPPVDKRYDENNSAINNDKINKMNFYIGKMCKELNVYFLNSASSLKDENGACKEGYCLNSDGIHLTKEGQNVLVNYAKTHMIISE